MSTEPVETFVFLPYSKYKALDNRAKKVKSDESSLPVSDEPQPNEDAAGVSINTSANSEPGEEAKTQLGKDVTKSYHGVQINRLIRHIEKTKGSTDVTSLTNLKELIKAALTNTRKKLPNEEMFFTFLFDNGMGHFVKNRSKIDLYYKDGLWYQV